MTAADKQENARLIRNLLKCEKRIAALQMRCAAIESERLVSPLRAAFKSLMRSPDSPALAANLRDLWDRFMVNPSGNVKAKFWPDAKGRLPGRES